MTHFLRVRTVLVLRAEGISPAYAVATHNPFTFHPQAPRGVWLLLTSSTLEGRFEVGVLCAQHVLWNHTLYPHFERNSR